MKLAPYPEYKDSGVPWLPIVPDNWRLERAKNLFAESDLPVRKDDEIVTCFRDGQVTLRRNRRERGFMNALLEVGYQGVRNGQLVVHAMDAFAGAIGVSDSDGKCTPEYVILTARIAEIDLHYYALVLREMARLDYIRVVCPAVRERAPRLRYPNLAAMYLPVPGIEVQERIVRFSHSLKSRIGIFIRNKRRLIELLKEQKQNVINQAVTRGLDPKVKFKPSGVEWIGDIPEHWDVRRLKYLLREVDERSITGEERHLSMSQKHGGLVSSSEIEEHRLMSDSYAGGKLCRFGDIVLNRLKAHLGVFAHAPCGGVISQDYSVFRAIADIEPVYYEYLLRSTVIRPELRIRCKGIVEGFWRLYSDDFLSFKVPFPQRDEQLEIVEGIEERFFAIDQTISRTQREIELMREYRNRLISDVVTGQVDLRGIEVPEVTEEELLALDEDTAEGDDMIDAEGDMDEAD